MKGESLKCCSIYSESSTTQGVKHLCGDIACIHTHTHTHTDSDAYARLSCTHSHPRQHTHMPIVKLCSWPKTASFSSSLHFGQWGAHSCKRPGFDAPPPTALPSYHTERICWLTKCDYPRPFITLLVRRVTERNIWRNQLILSYPGTRGLCFITTAAQLPATHKPVIAHWQHINTASAEFEWRAGPPTLTPVGKMKLLPEVNPSCNICDILTSCMYLHSHY